jgi:hypothetical protein
VVPGFQTIDRTDDDGYYLQGAETSWECRNAGNLIIRWWDGPTLAELPVSAGESIVCTMTIE